MVSHLTDSKTCTAEEAQGQGSGENEALFWEAKKKMQSIPNSASLLFNDVTKCPIY